MKTNENIWQVLTNAEMGTSLYRWVEGQEAAIDALKDAEECFPDNEFWIEEGTEYIYKKCRHCGTVHANERSDSYGISTGVWCEVCYNSSNYPYRKDRYYDPSYAGERMEEDY